MYAVPTYRRDPLDRRNKSWILTVECHGEGKDHPDRTFEHLSRIRASNIELVVGQFALPVMD